MKAGLFALALLVPLPAGALGLPALEGRWQGEGVLHLGDEPPQRLRCQVRLRATLGDKVAFSGRCATAQGSQSFVYLLSEPAPGVVMAENRSDPPDDLPARMQGRTDPQGLLFQADGGALFELVREGASLRFVIAGHDSRGPARGEALLTLRE